MPNTNVYTDKVAAKIVRRVKNKLGIAGTFTKKFEMDFEDNADPIGQTLRVKKPLRGRIVDGFDWVGGDYERIWTTVGPFQPFHVELQAGALEKMFEMERGERALDENLYNPLTDQLAQEIDSRAAVFAALNTSMRVGAIGTTPTSFDTFGSATTRINEKDGFTGNRRAGMFISPEAQRSMVSGTPNALALFHNGGANPNTVFREGVIGRYSGYEIEESMSLYTHTSGIVADVAVLTVSVTSLEGATSIVIAATTGDTFKAGDSISVAGRSDVNPTTRESLFRDRILAIAGVKGQTYTAAAGVVTLPLVEPLYGPASVYQNILTLPTALDVVTFNPGTTMVNGLAKSGRYGMVYTNDAFALVGAKVPRVKKTAFDEVASYQDPDTGIEVAILGWTVPESRQQRWRADVCIGFGNLMGATSSSIVHLLN